MPENAKVPEVVILRVSKETGEVEKLSLEEALDKLSNFYKDLEEVKRALLEGVTFPSSVATYQLQKEEK